MIGSQIVTVEARFRAAQAHAYKMMGNAREVAGGRCGEEYGYWEGYSDALDEVWSWMFKGELVP